MVSFGKQPKEYSPGEMIAGYTVLSSIGSGGYGHLYLVQDVSGAAYALKILKNGTDREFSALQKIRLIPPFPGLTAIHAAGRLPDGRIYYLMDAADNLPDQDGYLPDTLANRMARQGHFSAPEVLRLAASLLPAVRHLHEHGAAHHDIKPENIIFIRNTPMLADFGSLDRCDTAAGFPAVTSGFFPPEELSGTVNGPFSAKTDLYALGMTLYCVWSGHIPEDYPLLPDDVDTSGIRVIRKLLLKACNPAPAYRFQNAEAFLQAVIRAQRQLTSPAFRKRKIIVPILIAFLCAVLAGIMLREVRQQRSKKHWETVESKVDLAKTAEKAGILSDLKFAGTAVKSEPLNRSTADFQRLHDLLMTYEKWEKARGTERRKLETQILVMAERCPCAYRDPRTALHGYLLTQRELSPEEKGLYRKAESVCGKSYRQLQLEITAVRKNPNISPVRREQYLRAKESQQQELKAKYPQETAYMDICRELQSAYEIRDIIRLRQKLETLKSKL